MNKAQEVVAGDVIDILWKMKLIGFEMRRSFLVGLIIREMEVGHGS